MKYLFILLFFINFPLLSQSWYLKRKIDWYKEDLSSQSEISIFDFSAFRFGYFKDNNPVLPCFSDIIEWHTPEKNVDINIFSAEYESIPGGDKYSEMFSFLSNQIIINYNISVENKKPFIIYEFYPFRINPDTRKIERLKEFILEIEQVPLKKNNIIPKKSDNVPVSVLATGEWFKIRISSTGIYKLTFEQLKLLGLTDPATVRIFGYGGQVLPEDIREGGKDDLLPVQIYMHKGADNIFNKGDYILFYGAGTDEWYYDDHFQMFRCRKNPYSDYSYYFLTCNNGSIDEPDNVPAPEAEITSQVNYYDFFAHHELYLRNLIKSGRKWYGEEFDLLTTQTFSFQVPGLIFQEPVTALINVLSRAIDTATFKLEVNGNDQETFRIRPINFTDYNGTYAFNQQKQTSFNSSSEDINLKLRYLKPEPASKGWLDFITINAKAEIALKTDQLIFRNKAVVASNAITHFNIANADGNTIIWDVSEPNNIKNISYKHQQGSISFVSETSKLREFAVFRKAGNYPSPDLSDTGLGRIENQNLHGINVPDMVIITHQKFIEQAQEFAQYRSEKNNISIFITTPDKIYNEFSSGTPDVTALRNFLSMLYERGSDKNSLKNLLLFGDGSYDNKGVNSNPGNLIPTCQSENSILPTASFVSDDYFALLDPGEPMLTGLLDIGVGRIPVVTVDQAKTIINKIKEYEEPVNMGKWRNVICFIGDDEDYNIHMLQADQLAGYVQANYPDMNINKIYLDAYKQHVTPVGQRYPEVNKAINDQVSRGALIINYTGHGGVDGLAHEKILTMSDINSWKNKGKYPLFLTATCDFSRFDDFERITAGEGAILNPSGGVIALLTTTRLVYSGPNHALNERFYELIFEKKENNDNYCLGDILKYIKNKTGAGINKRNFTLLGDPSLKLAHPVLKILTDSINHRAKDEPPDTLKAFSSITISGHVEDHSGNIMRNMDGIIYPMVYDKPVHMKTLANDGGAAMTFSLQNNILYNGKASLKGGYFSFSFIVPKDINYSFGTGKLSFYAHDETIDASGSFSGIVTGGTKEQYPNDLTGPKVEVYLDNENFKAGDISSPNPLLLIKIYDESGVNTTGNGVGHDIIAVLDDQSHDVMVLNEYFQADMDSYKGGRIEYPLFNLKEGSHKVDVKVWDIYNNSGEGSVEFIVVDSKEFFLNKIFNFPNPFNENTWFSFGHNQAGEDLEITIEIFNSLGELVRILKTTEFDSEFRSEPVEWDGKDSFGNKNRQGLYVYRIKVKNSQGKTAEKSGRLMIIR